MDEILRRAAPAFSCPAAAALARTLAYSHLLCLGRHTITQSLTTCGRQHVDWSAAYRLFERERIEERLLFAPIRKGLQEGLAGNAPLAVALDDTVLPRRGKKVAGTGWHRDPQGPPFAHQIQWNQRVVQIVGYLPQPGTGAVRAVPLDSVLLDHVPRPSKKADDKAKAAYNKEKARAAATTIACQRVAELRQRMDGEGGEGRPLHVSIDGGYTNKTLFRSIPPGVTLIGRLRKDACLRAPAVPQSGKGRPPLYGEVIDTPEALLASEAAPWHEVTLFAAGQRRTFRYKRHESCCWPRGSGSRRVRVLALQPLSKSHDKRQRLFFTHPGYIICSDPSLSDEVILQHYINRWEIEVGFREQKTTLGLGEAQTRTKAACRSVLAFRAFCYAMLLLGAARSELHLPPRPLWQRRERKGQRATIGRLLGNLRGEVWGAALGAPTLDQLVSKPTPTTKCPKITEALQHAVLYAQR